MDYLVKLGVNEHYLEIKYKLGNSIQCRQKLYSYESDPHWKGFEKGWNGKIRLGRKHSSKKKKKSSSFVVTASTDDFLHPPREETTGEETRKSHPEGN